jgi:excisionase family DNA binding protein
MNGRDRYHSEEKPLMEGKTYTLEETARLLRLSKDAARDAVRTGRIKAIKPGGKYLVLKDPLNRPFPAGLKFGLRTFANHTKSPQLSFIRYPLYKSGVWYTNPLLAPALFRLFRSVSLARRSASKSPPSGSANSASAAWPAVLPV